MIWLIVHYYRILGKVYTGRADCGKWLGSGLTDQEGGIVGRNLGRQEWGECEGRGREGLITVALQTKKCYKLLIHYIT